MSQHEHCDAFPGQRVVSLPPNVVVKALEQPLLRGLLPTDVGVLPNAEEHLRERTEGVDRAIFIYCTKGDGWCVLRGQRHEVHAGDLLVVPPREPHIYGADESQPWTISWFHLAGDDVIPLLQELGASTGNPVLYLGEDPQLLALFEDGLQTLEHGYAHTRLFYASRIFGHLVGLMVQRCQERWRGDLDSGEKVAQCIAYMKLHLDKPLRLPILASLVHLSPSHFNALFRRETGYSCMDYFIRLRMDQACQLLDTATLNIKNIAACVGYEDQLWFSKLFKTVTGLSPTDYRRAHAKPEQARAVFRDDATRIRTPLLSF
jgi:AraC family transcriptional regulator, arabinose operon regulatory protein